MALLHRVRVSLTGLSTGPGLSTFYFAEGSGSAAAAAIAVKNFLNAIRSRVNDGGSMMIEGDVALIEATTGEVVGVNQVTQDTVTGADGGEALPLATQGLLQLRTGVYVGGRELRGRLYIPAPTEGMNTVNGVPDAIYTGQIAAAGNALILDGGSDWVVYSRKHAAFSSVAACTGWSKWAVLRTRRD